MAYVRKPKGRDGYQGVYVKPDGREATRMFDRKKDAQQWADEQERQVKRGEWLDPRSGSVTVAEYGQDWLAGKLDVKKSTRDAYERLLRCQVIPTFGKLPLSAVTHEGVARWVAALHASGLSASRIRLAHLVLKQVLDLAVFSRRIPSNPADKVRLPSLPSKAERDRESRFLSLNQVQAVASHCRGADVLPLHVMAWCGLRSGEVAGLRVCDFDQLRRELHVRQTVVDEGGVLRVETPKTRSSVRTVPVPSWLVPMLAEQLVGKGEGDPLLTAPQGGLWRANNWRRRVMDPAIRKAGVARQEKGDMVSPHDLRHTCASLHIQAGTPVKVLSEMLGHTSVAFTMDRYGHLYPGDTHRWVDALGAAAEAARLALTEQAPNEFPNEPGRLMAVGGSTGL